jgi:hypothetical protein
MGRAKLGYDRSHNNAISSLLDQGEALDCRVLEVDTEVGVWNRMRMDVDLII